MAFDLTAAQHHWPEILRRLGGLAPEQLSNRHQPCPLCGGRDRYRFDDKDGSGSWFCNQCGGKDRLGGGGSGIDLLMRLRGWTYARARRELEHYLASGRDASRRPLGGHGRPSTAGSVRPAHGSAPRQFKACGDWRQPEVPPPDADPPLLDQGAIAQWCYRNATGAPLFWVQRLCLGGGRRKAYLHRVWLDGHWHRPSRRDGFRCDWPAPKPLYGLPLLSARPSAPVLVVEGEATADAAAVLFPEQVVVSWCGGAQAHANADWLPLQGRSVTLWPDADAPGLQAMEALAEQLCALHCEVRMVRPPDSLPGGWDLADADWSIHQAAEHLAAWSYPWSSRQDPASDPSVGQAPHQAGDNPPTDRSADHPADPSVDGAANASAKAELPFQCLGYDNEACYYRSHRTGQVVRLSRASHTSVHLVALAPLRFWETLYPSRSGVSWAAAASDLHEQCIAAGLFSAERIRGRGAWWDQGQPVLHLGDRLVLPGRECPITAPPPSRFVYQRMPRLDGPGDVVPLSVVEAAVIVAIANRFHWDVPASGTLLLGWVVLAPICGALRWRPHLWLTASAGSGKSAILDRFVAPLLGDFALLVSGCTTEAGLRQSIGSDAVPVVFDEAEGNERSDQQRLQGILALARVASSESGASLIKGSPSGEVSRYRVRSMFLLSSIATALKQGADRSRFAQLTLRNPADLQKVEREAHWRSLDRDLDQQITSELGRRLIARTISLIPVIRDAAEIFCRAAARHFDSQRLGDQYGTLLAGAWSLLSDVAPTEAEAELCIASHQWESYSQSAELTDEQRCLQVILQAALRVECADRTVTRTAGELVDLAAHHGFDPAIPADLAAQSLARHGLRVDADRLLVSNTAQPIAALLRDTAWVHSWPLLLQRLSGAQRTGAVRFCGAGMVTRAVSLPLALL
jgi:putative DNA primase/helicase